MIDFQRYDANKKAGGVTLQKIGESAVAIIRKFHPNTGKELVPDMGPVDIPSVLKQREAAAQVLAGYDSFIADIKALGVDVTPPAADQTTA